MRNGSRHGVMQREEALALLGVAATASVHKIRIAYWIKAKESHPDVGGTAEMFDRVRVAYQLLMQLAEGDRSSGDSHPSESRSDPSPERSTKADEDPSFAAFGPVNDPLIKTDQASMSRLKP
jgi:DnaJ-class molecular chaperone